MVPPFENRSSKSPVFKCLRFSSCLLLDPSVVLYSNSHCILMVIPGQSSVVAVHALGWSASWRSVETSGGQSCQAPSQGSEAF